MIKNEIINNIRIEKILQINNIAVVQQYKKPFGILHVMTQKTLVPGYSSKKDYSKTVELGVSHNRQEITNRLI